MKKAGPRGRDAGITGKGHCHAAEFMRQIPTASNTGQNAPSVFLWGCRPLSIAPSQEITTVLSFSVWTHLRHFTFCFCRCLIPFEQSELDAGPESMSSQHPPGARKKRMSSRSMESESLGWVSPSVLPHALQGTLVSAHI